ncbi:MAG TPA: FxSxx-COOH system tetratricopeptide repeat protein, partial [Hyphomicrobiaceae bacterium]|nr:FxSxx-COOH system tetratricopeptide repeat protein [Hyphomicrobiaceae bacterium]
MAELIPVAAGPQRSKASVIFVHGLSGHALRTWGATETTREKFWPAWLAEERRLAGLSVFTLSYEADSSELFGKAMSLFDLGENVLATLLAQPALCNGPIAFVAHSLGGLVVKQVLREAFEQRERDPAARRFLDQVSQVCFIATPHQGSRLPVLIERWGWFAWRPTIVMKSLRDGDEGLLKLKRWYTNFCGADPGRIRHLVFRETQRTNRVMVVTEASADPGVPAEQIPIAASHVDIAKPVSRGAEVYRRIRDSLEDLLAERRSTQPRIVPAKGRLPDRTRGRILHREVREVPGLAARPEMDEALDIAFGRNPNHPIALTNSGQVTRSVAGMAGVGKTELARAFAWRNRDAYEGVWWVAAESREGAMQGLVDLGERIAPEIGAISQLERAAEETVARIEANPSEKPFLIVFDNVPSPADLDGLMPRTRSHVLVTSRWSDWFGTAEKLDVGLFSEEQAVEHLTRAAADKDREGAARLARDLGFLPLAIDHAASYRRSRRANSFDDYRERLSELIHAKPGPRARAHLYPMSVHRTFTLALEQMSTEHEGPVETVMAMAAFMAPDAIPVSVLGPDVLSPEDRDAALAALAEVSLISLAASGTGEPMFTVHRLVQLIMLDRLEENGRSAEMFEIAIDAVDSAFPRTAFEFAGWPVTRPLVPHARSVLRHAKSMGQRSEAVARLGVKLAQYLVATGSVSGVEELLLSAIHIYEDEQGADSNAVGVASTTLAQLYESQGRYSEAGPLLQRDLEITAESLGTDHPQYAATLTTLAQLHVAQDRQADAEPLLEQALGIDEQALGADHPETLSVLGSLAGVYVAQGRYAAAEPLLRRALAVTERVSGAVHPDTAAASGRLAELYVTLGRYAEAASLLERDLAIAEELLGAEHPETAAALTSVAQLYVTLGQYERSEPLYERALA